MELVRRITCTERPGYEPDGDGFVRKTSGHDALLNWATIVNAREQERKAMNVTDAQNIFNAPNLQQGGLQAGVCHHGIGVSALGGCLECANEKKAQAQGAAVGQWAPPETMSGKLARFAFQLQNTMTSLSELQREVEKLRGSL